MILHKDFFGCICVIRGLISSHAILHRKKVDTGFIQAGMSPSDDLQGSAVSKSLYKVPVSVQVKLVFLHIQNYIQTLRSAKTRQKMLLYVGAHACKHEQGSAGGPAHSLRTRGDCRGLEQVVLGD